MKILLGTNSKKVPVGPSLWMKLTGKPGTGDPYARAGDAGAGNGRNQAALQSSTLPMKMEKRCLPSYQIEILKEEYHEIEH